MTGLVGPTRVVRGHLLEETLTELINLPGLPVPALNRRARENAQCESLQAPLAIHQFILTGRTPRPILQFTYDRRLGKSMRLPSKSYVAGAIAAALLLASTWSVGAAASGSEDNPDGSEGVIATRCDPNAAGTLEGWCDSADTLPDVGRILAAVQAQAGDRYAGRYLDRSGATPRQVIMFTNLTVRDQELLDTITDGDKRVVAAPATYTARELDEALNLLSDKLDKLNEDFRIGLRPSANALALTVANRDMAQIVSDVLVEANLPTGIVQLTVGDSAIEPALNRNSYPPHAGGLRLELTDLDDLSVGLCTSGFSILSDGGTHMGVTAGHCATGYLADGISIGNDYLSRSGQNSYRGHSEMNSDSMRYTVPSGDAWHAKIFVHGDTIDYRWVDAPRYTMDTLQEGTHLCFQGTSSDNDNCGDVFDEDVTTRSGSKELHHMFGIDHAAIRGDSGGPVDHVNSDGSAKPAGIVQGIDPSNHNYMYFSQIRLCSGRHGCLAHLSLATSRATGRCAVANAREWHSARVERARIHRHCRRRDDSGRPRPSGV
jgi:hypothetical protein